ncbi:hypothetical protein C8N26_2054 [Tenacibaculum lutimaris]|uniref:Uncharacterized protein n=1 Tax=Tenacibaculum lutimaris TaxID=285258 RepID=A0A420E0Q3_9FLAO|nr:hypothetical protein [Tenacibaculum lutimaris]RKF03660.1 hypothetical protein C8N26_2054 [Tenacibaculum lutimaris]
MKRIILVIVLALTGIVSNAQQYERKESLVEVRVEVEIESEVISHSLSITLSKSLNNNSSLNEEKGKLLFHLDSIGVKKADISEEKKYVVNSNYEDSIFFLVKNLTNKQVISIKKLNKGNLFVGDIITLNRAKETEEVLIDKLMLLAEKKAKIIAKSIGKKVKDIQHVTCSTDFKKEYITVYTPLYSNRKYYAIVTYTVE